MGISDLGTQRICAAAIDRLCDLLSLESKCICSRRIHSYLGCGDTRNTAHELLSAHADQESVLHTICPGNVDTVCIGKWTTPHCHRVFIGRSSDRSVYVWCR